MRLPEDEPFYLVAEDPVLSRIMLNEFLKKGVKINVDPKTINAETVTLILHMIFAELKLRENVQ